MPLPNGIGSVMAMVVVVLLGTTHLGGCGLAPAQTSALMELYNATGGHSWRKSQGWMSGDPCTGGWFGVGCNPGNTDVVYVAWRPLFLLFAIDCGRFGVLCLLPPVQDPPTPVELAEWHNPRGHHRSVLAVVSAAVGGLARCPLPAVLHVACLGGSLIPCTGTCPCRPTP